ncbi:MAG: lipopolysaccharide biosynthesis protein [Bacteroidales bacterium]|nr:lipopolysaccharide biosynthesis protein [Bacteroidales bacterium]
MSSATQRFLAYELGKKEYDQLGKVFSMSLNIHVIIGFIIFVLAEVIGVWFLNTQLNIPTVRINAANWVYQFSVFSFMLTIMSVPYNASIVARERMNVYAYISIIEVSLKLLIVFMLQWFGYDKLKMYAVLVFVVTIIIQLTQIYYCKYHFRECRYVFSWNRSLYKTLMSYAGWNLWGNAASVAMNQGINILLNIFFSPAVNAARGVAYQVNGAVNGFVSNFQMAINPQIVKSYAKGDKTYMHQLIIQGSKYSFYLLFLLSLPILIETESILAWWLKIVPDYTATFCRLVLLNTLIDSISGTLMTAAQASGRIKVYQSVVGGLLLLILPISFLLLKFGYPPQTTLFVSIAISFMALFIRLRIVSALVNLSTHIFLKEVLLKLLLVSIVAIAIPILIKINIENELIRFILVCLASLLSVSLSVFFIGLKRNEQVYIKRKIKSIIDEVKMKKNVANGE